MTQVIDLTKGIKLREGLGEYILHATRKYTSLPAAGLYASNQNQWNRARAWSCHRQEDSVRVQMAAEPYPPNTPRQLAWNIANIIDQEIRGFVQENPGEAFPEDAQQDAETLRRRAATDTHTIGPEQMGALIRVSQETGFPPGAIARMIAATAAQDPIAARHILGRSLKEWRQSADQEQTRQLLEHATELDFDRYALLTVSTALGYPPHWNPSIVPHTTSETRQDIHQAALDIGFPEHIAQRLQKAL